MPTVRFVHGTGVCKFKTVLEHGGSVTGPYYDGLCFGDGEFGARDVFVCPLSVCIHPIKYVGFSCGSGYVLVKLW